MELNKETPYINQDYYSFIVVRTIAERDNIPCKLRQDGMVVTVVEQDYYQRYQIQAEITGFDICDNRSWERVIDAGPGLSAYEVWLSAGNVGSEGDFIEYLSRFSSMYFSLVDGELIIENYKGDYAEIVDGELILR